MDFEALWNNEALRSNVGVTVAYAAVVIVVQLLTLRYVRRAPWLRDTERLSWLGRVRLAAGLALLGGIVLVWATQLQALALSAVAIAAALVLATKELILCVSGGVVRRAGDAFDIGDRIEVGGHRGDVVRLGLFSLSLLEIGPGHQRTGRAVTLPNSIFLSQAVVNESFTQDYVLHITSVPFVREESWREAEQSLLAAAREACAAHLDAARLHMEKKAQEHGLSAPSVEPRVLVQISGEGQRTLLVRFPVPARDRARFEQEILRSYSASPVAESGAE